MPYSAALDGKCLRRAAATINSSRDKAAKSTYLAANQDVILQTCTHDEVIRIFIRRADQVTVQRTGGQRPHLLWSYLFLPRQTAPTMPNTRQ